MAPTNPNQDSVTAPDDAGAHRNAREAFHAAHVRYNQSLSEILQRTRIGSDQLLVEIWNESHPHDPLEVGELGHLRQYASPGLIDAAGLAVIGAKRTWEKLSILVSNDDHESPPFGPRVNFAGTDEAKGYSKMIVEWNERRLLRRQELAGTVEEASQTMAQALRLFHDGIGQARQAAHVIGTIQNEQARLFVEASMKARFHHPLSQNEEQILTAATNEAGDGLARFEGSKVIWTEAGLTALEQFAPAIKENCFPWTNEEEQQFGDDMDALLIYQLEEATKALETEEA